MATLKINKLNKNFGSTEVLKGINLDIKNGDFLVLLGPSGCGKSTLLNTIAGLETSNSGDILIDEHVVNNMEPSDRDIALVFQSYALYPAMTVRKNVTFGLEQRKISKEKIEVSLRNVANLLQINELLERKPSQLSGGQRQRISIARALATQPRLLVCDEPTSALDVSIQAQILNLLKDLQEQLNLTILFISHDLPVVRQMYDRIGVLRNGKLCEVSDAEKLFLEPKHEYSKELLRLMPKIESIYN